MRTADDVMARVKRFLDEIKPPPSLQLLSMSRRLERDRVQIFQLQAEPIAVTDGGGRWLAEVLGRLPHNLIGIVDDRTALHRARRWIEMNED